MLSGCIEKEENVVLLHLVESEGHRNCAGVKLTESRRCLNVALGCKGIDASSSATICRGLGCALWLPPEKSRHCHYLNLLSSSNPMPSMILAEVGKVTFCTL
jgi:hypothetical protein